MTTSIVYIMGVAGSGKTTIGSKLSAATGIPFYDGDDFHPEANKEKMKAGKPLTDEDRIDWLLSINSLSQEQSEKSGAIIGCSALKEKYRDILSGGIEVPVHWILLQGGFGLIHERMKARKDHFMPASLLQSQFDTLENPANALIIDINKSPEQILAEILKEINFTSE